MLLIAGSCIGGGMLALPILTGLAGFFPSMLMFFCAWLFMTTTALLLVEVHGWLPKDVNLLSMMEHSLGRGGKAVGWFLFLFLFYAILVAYISGIGSLVSTFVQTALNTPFPAWGGSLFFVALFGWVVYLGTRQVDLWNRGLMFGKAIAFLALVFLGAKFVQREMLVRSEMAYAPFSLPVLVISFGFHNMIPSLHSYLGGSVKRVRLSILGGSLMALGVYLIWQVIVLGIVPFEDIVGTLKTGGQASQAVVQILGISWLSNFTSMFAFFAILTSFLAQSLSLVHFLADGFKIPHEKKESVQLCCLTLLPPLFIALLYPQLFLAALNFAGGICAVLLFGIFPALMVWIGRYKKRVTSSYRVVGGRAALIAVFAVSLMIFFFQLSSMFNAPYLPKL